MAGDDVTITVTANSQQAQQAFRDLKKEVRGLKGTLVPLASAAVPLAAALAPIAVKAAGAGVAVAAFGAAVAGQASKLSAASKAQEAYNKAAFQYGAGSKQAAEAARTTAATFEAMPVATARAAVALGTLKDEVRAFSDESASFTMVPVEKSFTVLGQIIPKLTPMAKGAASQLDRLVSVAGGAVASPGFDAYADKVATFANESLQDAVDGAIHFARALSEGDAEGPVKAFMEYAEANGPALRETLSSAGDAVSTLAEAAANAGPGMLTLVNAGARLVASLPPELVTVLMQTAVALKAVSLAGAGMAAVSTGVAALGARIAALQAASAAAGGGMAGLAAAFGTLGKAAKASIVVAGVAALAVAFKSLSDIGEKAPPNVDKLTTSLGELGRTGKATGYVADQFGKDFGKLRDQIDRVIDPSVAESINNWGADITNGLLDAGDATEEFTKSVDAIDEGLTALVKGGKGELAKAALAAFMEGMSPEQAKKFRGELDGYDDVLADVALEAQWTADSMGVFGAAAQATSGKLEAQKRNADALRQSIFALNDVNRSAHDAQTQFEQSLDDLTESFAEHGATLNRDTEAGRQNRDAMSQAAKAHDEMIVAGVAANETFASMAGSSEKLRGQMMTLAEATLGSKEAATEYVNTLLGTPESIKSTIKLEREAAIQGLEDVRAAIAATPGEKEVRVDTLSGAAIAALENVGLKTRQLPDGKTAVYTANGKALGAIGAVSTALNNLDGKTANTYVNTFYTKVNRDFRAGERAYTNKATGGILEFYADGGTREQHIAEIAPAGTMRVWAEPETGGEAYIPLAGSKRSRSMAVLAETADRFGYRLQKYASGGMTDTQKDLIRSFGISHFGEMAGYRRDPFEKSLGKPADLGSLVSSLNELRGQIKTIFSGKSETKLLKSLDSVGKRLIGWEKQLTSVTKSLEKARDKLDSLKDAAAQVSSSVKSGILSAANITRGAGGDTPVTVASVMGGLTESRDKASAFAKALADLKKKGLSSALIQQIADAGIEGGGLETAGALLGASSSEIKSMNDLQSQINKAAGSAGKTTADALYGAQIKAQEKYVKSLEGQQKKLTTAMEKLAHALEYTLAKAMAGGKAAGGIVGAASGGIRSNLTWVGEHGPELLDLAPGSRVWSNPDSRRMAAAPWASMLNTPRGGTGAAKRTTAYPGGDGDGQPIVIQLKIGEREFGEVWVDVGRKQVRDRGGINATLLPPRGR